MDTVPFDSIRMVHRPLYPKQFEYTFALGLYPSGTVAMASVPLLAISTLLTASMIETVTHTPLLPAHEEPRDEQFVELMVNEKSVFFSVSLPSIFVLIPTSSSSFAVGVFPMPTECGWLCPPSTMCAKPCVRTVCTEVEYSGLFPSVTVSCI